MVTGNAQEPGRLNPRLPMPPILPKKLAVPKPSSLTGQARALELVRTALIEKKMTQAELADASDCHEKTIQNLMAGKSVRQQTLFDVCMVLGLDYQEFRDLWAGGKGTGGPIDGGSSIRQEALGNQEAPGPAGVGGDIAPVYMGAYTRAGTDQYLGSFVTLRPAFSMPDLIIAYRTDITWDPTWPSLLFEERDRIDAPYAHRGRLYIPASSQFIHLVSLTKGAMRMVLVSQIDQDGIMRGLITTLNKRRAQFVPVAAPIVYLKRSEIAADALGEIKKSHPQFAAYRQALQAALDDDYAALKSVD
jgi:DNA-binding Xre family transcriptional regulator